MKQTTRACTLLLALAMLLMAASGCGSGGASSAAQTETAAETASAAPSETVAPSEAAAPSETAAPASASSAETPDNTAEGQDGEEGTGWPANPLGTVELPLTDTPVDVTMWMGVNPNVLAITDDIGNDCVLWNELATRTGVNLTFTTCNPDTESEKFNLMVASDDLTDVISNATALYSGGGDKAIDDEVLIDCLPYLNAENTPQIQKLLDQYPDALTEGLTDGGYLAGLPQLSMQTETTQTFGCLIRQDWLDQLGLDAPETYDQLHDTLCQFRDELGADAALNLSYCGTGIGNGLVEGYGIYGMVADTGVSTEPFYQVDDKIQFGPMQPAFKDYLAMVNKWYAEGLIWQDFMSYSDFQNPPTDLILADRCGVFYGEVTFIASLADASDTDGFQLVATPDFVQKTGDTIPFREERTYAVATPWSISTKCECPELLMQWCNYMYTDDGALLCNYGIEGESFVWGDDGAPVFTDLVLNNPDMSTTVALFMYCLDRGPFYRDETREQSGYTEAQKAASDIWQSNMEVGRGIGTTTLNTEESDAANQVYSDIKTYVEEMILSFIVGNASLDEYDAYVQHIQDLGIDKVIAQYQSAYERYLSGDTTAAVQDPGPPPPGAPAP